MTPAARRRSHHPVRVMTSPSRREIVETSQPHAGDPESPASPRGPPWQTTSTTTSSSSGPEPGGNPRAPARHERREGALAGTGPFLPGSATTGRPRRCSSAASTSPRGLVRRARPRVPARGQLLRRGQHQVLRRGAVPAAAGGLRRASPPRWDLAGLADLLRRPRALLHPGRAPLPRARPARRGPERGPGERAVRLPAGVPRTPHPAAERRPGEARAAPVPPADRGQPRRGGAGPGGPDERLHPLRPGRWLPVPGGRQVGLAGHLRGSGAVPGQRHPRDRRPRAAPRDRRLRAHGHGGRHDAGRRIGHHLHR